MEIRLSSKQAAYLQSLVNSGTYATLQEAADARLSPPADDLWMKPYIDEALADIQDGKTAPWSVDDLRSELRTRHPNLANDQNNKN